MPPCTLKVSPLKTKGSKLGSRSICSRPAGTDCTVSGGLGSLALTICYRHRHQLERMGLTVEKAKPFGLAIEDGRKLRKKRKARKVIAVTDGVPAVADSVVDQASR